MNICLVRCPSPFLIDDKTQPPLGLMAVGAGLKRQGHEVTIHDGPLDSLGTDFDGYGFGPTSPEYPWALKAKSVVQEVVSPRARIVLGGPYVSVCPDECDRDGWDGIVVGDGEIAAELVFEKGGLHFGEERPLDEYPMPDRTLVDTKSYTLKIDGRPATTMMTSRGCPWNCAYCSKNQVKARLLSVPRVVEEIDVLHRQFGYDALSFPEDIFILKKDRTELICEALRARGIVWRCLVRADLVVKYGPQFCRMMKRSGCVSAGMGIESGSDRILQNVGKWETVEDSKRAVEMLHAAGIRVKGFLIVGLPGEDEQSLADTEQFLEDAHLDNVECKIFQPYPGSPIYDQPYLYDVRWTDTPLEHSYFKGHPGEYHGSVRTSGLSTEQIVAAWKRIDERYSR